MSLTKLFPPGVQEIPLFYLSLPELLAYERENADVARLLTQKHLWRKRLLNEYKLSPAEVNAFADPRAEYYSYYVQDALRDGYAFELGLLCLPLRDVDYKSMEQSREDLLAFITGTRVGNCVINKKRTRRLGLLDWLRLPGLVALHQGNLPIIRREKSVLRDIIPYSQEMIDNLIREEIQDPNTILTRLRSRARPKDLALAAYLSQRYAHYLKGK